VTHTESCSAGMTTSGSATFNFGGDAYEWHQGFPYIVGVNISLLNLRAEGITRANRAKNQSHHFFIHVPLNSVLHELAGAAQRQLFLDMGLVGLDSFYADVQFFRNLPGSMTFSD
jgi:hypothetical protein